MAGLALCVCMLNCVRSDCYRKASKQSTDLQTGDSAICCSTLELEWDSSRRCLLQGARLQSIEIGLSSFHILQLYLFRFCLLALFSLWSSDTGVTCYTVYALFLVYRFISCCGFKTSRSLIIFVAYLLTRLFVLVVLACDEDGVFHRNSLMLSGRRLTAENETTS